MIGVIGGGAFGTALAVALARAGRDVTLWARDAGLRQTRQSSRLPGVIVPQGVEITDDMQRLAQADVVLLALPMQALAGFLVENGAVLSDMPLVACCKGVDLTTLRGPSALISAVCPTATIAVLTGPSFATDIAGGLPTALTLACADTAQGQTMQAALSTPVLRLYLSSDIIGAELGGALKNVIAIAAGVVVGAGLGESARAALITRGYAEMIRFARANGARSETLAGLSGFGDLVLTCTSDQSRNFRFGKAIGAGQPFPVEVTVEGAATARAVARLAAKVGVEMPITEMVSALIDGKISLQNAVTGLLSRPLKQE